ncbi:MAG: tRNA guanosine(34) transglycosylase Tgt [Planctomycetota bacterium]|jgi:queuine tRNA-ribosyltransferase
MTAASSDPCVTWHHEASDGAARAGTLHTPHGSVATPCFMAVGTLGGLKGVTVGQAEELGQGVLLANTYHLALRPGAEVVDELGGLHAFSGWNGPMLTDSGGYQVFSLATMRKIDEEGVHFRSHIDGARLSLTPETSIGIQRQLGADIIMAFDECPAHDLEATALRASIDRTHRWLERCISAWRSDNGPRGAGCQALYGIIQGGLDPALRRHSAEVTAGHDLPGIAVGGLAVGESAEARNAVLDVVEPILPRDKARYLMGVGTPLDLVEAVARGIDQFDCVLPTRMGRHGIAYTDDGPLRLKRAEHARSREPIDERTPSAASRHSRGYIRHLLKADEALGGVLISLHNLAYYQQLMARMRTAICDGTFTAFADQFRARYQP